ncbi:hypothetical protein A2303_07665 [Candidatus Falkowbacteria bacterium RIFOXYB2_FULL_47_14]|uniref:Cation-transporting P-type ATPase N-terminal domain-containing protein n=1 Tax=Candidatus Falkowbacteria bacterium RIFOXYA2_FULL_47_19 TaxID=1797994 RepID=A0A1F5SMH4_9BACT|nr:MAG: hypothetical protein A2227_04810 [Candidatus Falkowbacteria bacterium RIFOXYA2_FULL_47_19]OGF36009.1 MAG: hypothetical protein A2468_00515 [Candidatus Falkowbacteria bacterium RIFOXYC2_FULL_46_15]OGF43399.1 MAG: hypothetical protein A2303_07665 [Candidatus Falkowbacteria bacterium RIFOXYB2_FULL_47_14]
MITCHHLKIKTCLNELKTEATGLTWEEAEKRLNKYGFNELAKEMPVSRFNVFISQFKNPLAYVLVIAGTLSVVLGSYIDSAVIFGAVILNSIIGFIQENKANQAIAKLKNLVEHKAVVLRDGRDITINSRRVTIGDIVLIKAGNKIPADARLIEAIDLKVNEASLTGESLPSSKRTEVIPEGAALADRENMIYAGTLAVEGLGKAVVTGVGTSTEIGKIAELVAATGEGKTPLQLRLDKFSRFLGLIFGVICVLVVIIGLLQKRGFLEMVETGVAIGVASIPEGLTMSVTFILALGMQRILKKRALTRKLIAAETLGSTTVICTDKTGTLTEGNMHVAHIVIGEKEFEMDNPGTRQETQEAKTVSLALQTAMMCNDSIIENPDDELASWRFIGTPTENALLSAAIQSGLRREELLKIEPQVDELPFSSEKKFMLSLHRIEDGEYILYEKGAPEKLLDKSVKYHHHGGVRPLDKAARENLDRTYQGLTSRGLRVVGLAVREFKEEAELKAGGIDWGEIDRDLTFIGFIAIKDPLRKEAKETIKLCIRAGIRPVIITGDHKLTAKAIAQEVGLKAKEENVVTGEELDKLSDEKFGKLIKKIDVYARVSPHHKLRIVTALQAKGEVVAMTGDGINDSPALKAADIGISLGTGTDIAKETSDIVLLDNNFKTIVAAVEQGRVIFENIRKVITYLISDSFSEVTVIIGTILAAAILNRDIPLALLPTQILWINIVNDSLPHFSLAFEKGDELIMREKPIKKQEPVMNDIMKIIIFGAGPIRAIIIFSVFLMMFFIMPLGEIDYMRTVIFAILGISSLVSIFSLRDLKNPVWKTNPFSNSYLLGSVALSAALLLLGIYWGPLQMVLGTAPLKVGGWYIVIVISLLTMLIIEMAKFSFVPDKKWRKIND